MLELLQRFGIELVEVSNVQAETSDSTRCKIDIDSTNLMFQNIDQFF